MPSCNLLASLGNDCRTLKQAVPLAIEVCVAVIVETL